MPPTPAPELSIRQELILTAIAGGNTNAAIAQYLDLPEEAVKHHVRVILKKLHARNRAHAVAVAFRLDMLDHLPAATPPPH